MSIVLEFQAPPGKPVLRGIDHFWRVIRDLTANGNTFTVADVVDWTNRTHRQTVADYVNRLEKAGYVERTGDTVRRYKLDAPIYRLLKRPYDTPRLNRDGTRALQGRGQQQLWNVLRGPEARGGIAIADLALRASTEEVPVSHQSAKSYLKHLAAAGYLTAVRQGVWRLKSAMNTGPLPPMILRTKIVYDRNRSEAMAPIAAKEGGQ